MEKEDIFAEINTVECPDKVKVELYVFREHPEKDRMLLMKCVGDPERKQDYLAEVYCVLKDPCEWLKRYNEDE